MINIKDVLIFKLPDEHVLSSLILDEVTYVDVDLLLSNLLYFDEMCGCSTAGCVFPLTMGVHENLLLESNGQEGRFKQAEVSYPLAIVAKNFMYDFNTNTFDAAILPFVGRVHCRTDEELQPGDLLFFNITDYKFTKAPLIEIVGFKAANPEDAYLFGRDAPNVILESIPYINNYFQTEGTGNGLYRKLYLNTETGEYYGLENLRWLDSEQYYRVDITWPLHVIPFVTVTIKNGDGLIPFIVNIKSDHIDFKIGTITGESQQVSNPIIITATGGPDV